MTLDQALVAVHKCFAGGQTYVAISRVGPREGLRFAHPLSRLHIKTEKTFLYWDWLRVDMEQRKAAVMELLSPDQQREVESMGLKSLHAFAERGLVGKDSAGQPLIQDSTLRKALAAVKNALSKLKPARVKRPDPAMHHWQMLNWKSTGGGGLTAAPTALLQSPPLTAAGASGLT
jgi:hypothetical protein